MPWAPMRYCTSPGCGVLVAKGRCPDHRKAQQDERDKREVWRDYSSTEWKAARKTVLAREPQCRFCGEKATVVDHIVPLRDGGTHDIANLRPLCKSCHDRRTYEDNLGKRS